MKGVGPIEFGMTSEKVKSVMQELCGNKYKHTISNETDYFFGSALEVSYDDNGNVEFIGAQYHTNCDCDFKLYGVDPFNLEAKELFEHISSKQSENHLFDPDDYLFRENIITLWNSEEQYDYKGGETRPVYAQVGIGNSIYLAAIDSIKNA